MGIHDDFLDVTGSVQSVYLTDTHVKAVRQSDDYKKLLEACKTANVKVWLEQEVGFPDVCIRYDATQPFSKSHDAGLLVSDTKSNMAISPDNQTIFAQEIKSIGQRVQEARIRPTQKDRTQDPAAERRLETEHNEKGLENDKAIMAEHALQIAGLAARFRSLPLDEQKKEKNGLIVIDLSTTDETVRGQLVRSDEYNRLVKACQEADIHLGLRVDGPLTLRTDMSKSFRDSPADLFERQKAAEAAGAKVTVQTSPPAPAPQQRAPKPF